MSTDPSFLHEVSYVLANMLQAPVHLLGILPAAIFPISAQRPKEIPCKAPLKISQYSPDRSDVGFTHTGRLEKSIGVDLVIT